VEVRFAF